MDSVLINLKILDLLFLIENQTDTSYSEYNLQSIGSIVDENGFEFELESKWFCSGEDRETQSNISWFQMQFARVCNEIYILSKHSKVFSTDNDEFLPCKELLDNLYIEKEIYKSKIISLSAS